MELDFFELGGEGGGEPGGNKLISGKYIVFCGDFNIILLLDNSNVQNFKNLMYSSHFIPVITDATIILHLLGTPCWTIFCKYIFFLHTQVYPIYRCKK